MQGKIKDECGTVVPYMISSDETRLSTFSGDKKAHPVYLTIGNIPKWIRRRISSRATVLIGYLPVPKLNCIANEEKRRAAKRALFHSCMERLLAPLVDASKTGVEAVCADGGVRRIYPALAAYIADFPKQCKVACTKCTHCPLCSVAPDVRGDLTDAAQQDHDETLAAMAKHVGEGSARYVDLGLFEARPFWATHILIDMGSLLAPDLLHQLHKGMFKDHLAKWVQSVTSKATMDARYTSMPEHHGVRHFKNGITSVSQWTGCELKEMAKVFLPVVSDCDAAVIRAAWVLLDFTYLPCGYSEDKEAFVRLKAIEAGKFSNIPKLHMMQHYTHLIWRLGMPDGFNTETYERLHIDFAKAGYRASNRVNPLKQMAIYIQRIEAMDLHLTYLMTTQPEAYRGAEGTSYSEEPDYDPDAYDELYWEEEEDVDEDMDNLISLPLVSFEEFVSRGGKTGAVGGTWEKGEREGGHKERSDGGSEDSEADRLLIFYPVPEYKVSKQPTRRVKGDQLVATQATTDLIPAIQTFLCKRNPQAQQINLASSDVFLVWSRARLIHAPTLFKPSEGPKLDVLHAQLATTDQFSRITCPAHFETALVLKNPDLYGLHWYHACRIRAIFELPNAVRHTCPKKLVYVEMFNAFSTQPHHSIGLFTTSQSRFEGCCITAVF
ncbi:hypothetical protein FRC06_006385 [Ceratobasidium sp. 370]|nr:hypothetical protein FRC06_006385 [Ceratobasidium sp. 370]